MPSFTLLMAEILTDLFNKLGRDYVQPNPEEPMTPPTTSTSIPVPKLHRQLVIDAVYPDDNIIVFYTNQDTAQLFDRFGTMSKSEQTCYFLGIDPRYDFQEVLAYVRSFEGQPPNYQADQEENACS